MERGSYLLITPGMPVRSEANEELGRVVEVVADSNVDIFRGIVLSPGLLRSPVFVSQERVTSVTEDTVFVNVAREEVAHLPHTDVTV